MDDLRELMPADAWDSHIHIIDTSHYPLAPDASYAVTGVYAVWDNVIFENSIGAAHNVIIQPSIYGYDNTAVLQALEAYGPARSRAIVCFDPDVYNETDGGSGALTPGTLKSWHALGVRGVRVNLGFVSAMPSIDEFKATLRRYADIIRPLNWVIQMYIPMSLIAELETFLPSLRVRVVFDHLGHPDIPPQADTSLDPYSLTGFQSLINLLRAGNTWVKVSGVYRLTKDSGPLYRDLDRLILELFRVADTRLVYASDWPHTRFEGLDVKPWTRHLLQLTGDDETLRRRLFVDNARLLWE